MTQRSETFGRLLKGAISAIAAYEGKTAPMVEAELGAQIGVAGPSIQRYKTGYIPPEPRTVQILATAGMQRGLLARAWLVRFLQAARYPASETLIAQLANEQQAITSAPHDGLPSGTVALLFTDIVGSSARWEQDPREMDRALARHDMLLRQAVDAYGGVIFKTVGDAVHAAFTTVPAALQAAIAAQRALLAEPWGTLGPLPVRMAIHVGTPQQRDGDYFGPALNRLARLLDTGHGGQVLLTLSAHELADDLLPPGVSLQDLGEHRLRDLGRPERVFQANTPDLPDTFPPLRSLQRYRHNLPTQATALIGREEELAAVTETLREPGVRLLTLSGPGGIGKTRLALQTAGALLDDFVDGVWFVGLAAVHDPDLLLPAIAQVFELREQSGQPLADRIQSYLREKALLLILDNLEQLRAAGPAISALLAGAPGTKILATSRERLHLYGEHEYAVPPLELPERRPLPPIERLTQYEAVRLFIERAAAIRPDLAITADTAPVIAEICHRLDGLPLAIELAAARSKIFTPQAILSRLDRRLAMLIGGARDLPARQQTLRGTIDWSYNLLDGVEQECFARLGIFVGGCTVAAAVPVLTAGGDVLVDAEAVLDSLLDKSLVQQRFGADGEPRFVLLETLREYALERLAGGDAEPDVRRAHAHYYRDLAADGANGLRGPDEIAWMARLATEHPNLRTALAWLLDAAPDEAAHMVAALSRFWFLSCRWSEGETWIARALDRLDNRADSSRITLLVAAGSLAMFRDDHTSAQYHLSEAFVAAQAAGDLVALAEVATARAWGAFYQGDYTQWPELAAAAVDIARRSGSEWQLAEALQACAWQCYVVGELETAQTLDEESLAIAERLGSPDLRGCALGQLGWIAHGRGDYDAARRFVEASLPIAEAQHNSAGIAVGYNLLGLLDQAQGQDDAALRHFTRALELRREQNDRRGSVAIYANLANLHTTMGNLQAAAAACATTLQLAHEIAYPTGYDWGFGEAAIILAGSHPEATARLFGAIEHLHTTFAISAWPGQERMRAAAADQARAALGEAAYTAAFAAGRTSAIEGAIAQACEDLAALANTETL